MIADFKNTPENSLSHHSALRLLQSGLVGRHVKSQDTPSQLAYRWLRGRLPDVLPTSVRYTLYITSAEKSETLWLEVV